MPGGVPSVIWLQPQTLVLVRVAHRTQDGETALQLAIRNQLPLVVDAICTRGADMPVPDEKGNPPLWLALANNLEDIASTLVRQAQPQRRLHLGVFCVRGGFGASVAVVRRERSAG